MSGSTRHGPVPDEAMHPVDAGIAMSWFFVGADVGVCVGCFALEYFTVQRASRSFASLAGFSFQSCGISPALIASFSCWLLCCLGAWMIVAFTICPPLARYPDRDRCLSKRANRLSMAPVRISD